MKRFSREDGGRVSRRPRPHDCDVTGKFHVSHDGILEKTRWLIDMGKANHAGSI